jgi:hypothetical protein
MIPKKIPHFSVTKELAYSNITKPVEIGPLLGMSLQIQLVFRVSTGKTELVHALADTF